MNSFFCIEAKPKGELNNADVIPLSLIYLTTTPARELNSEMNFKYSSLEIINGNFTQEIIGIYNNKVRLNNSLIKDYQEDVFKKEKLLETTSSVVIYNKCNEEIAELQSLIKCCKSENEEYFSLIQEFKTIYNIMTDTINDKYFDFYYIYG